MKLIFITATLLAVVFYVPSASAQATLEVSNLEQSSISKGGVGSDSWIAQEFFITATDPNTYNLNSVQLLMYPENKSPVNFSICIYRGSLNGAPSQDLGNLSGSGNPSAAGTYTYTSTGITLLPGMAYFVVASAETALSHGGYIWSAAGSLTQSGNLNIDDVYFTSSNGGAAWSETLRQNVYQIAVFVTPVPEPTVTGLVFTGGIALACFLRKRGAA